jgi:PEP-CTERM motif
MKLLTSLLLTLLAVMPASAQILTNGSFELAPDLTGWSGFGGTSVLTPGTPYSNQDGVKVASLPASTNAGLTQLFTLTPNTNYTLSALVAGDVAGSDSVIRFLLGDSTFGLAFIDQRQFTVTATALGTAMTGISYGFNSGTVSAAGLQIDTFTAGGSPPRTVYLDKVTITAAPAAAPEPTTLAFLTLGSTLVVLRRRK